MSRPRPSASGNQRSVERYVTRDRLAPYLAECGGDFTCAESLYIWNLRVSGSFYEALAVFEVSLRNAVCEQLRAWHGKRAGAWLDDPRGVLDQRRIDQIQDARTILRQRGKPETEGRIVAELAFGFWRYLLTKRYERDLWTPHLRHAFPHMKPQRRGAVYDRVDGLHELRNRIAHHEPVHHYPLSDLHAKMIQVVAWIDADMSRWLASISRVPAVLAARPPVQATPTTPTP